MRFRMLHAFAWIQIVLGILSIVAAGVVLIAIIAMAGYASGGSEPGMPWLTGAFGAYLTVGLFFVGLQLGAMGQFCLVVMQIEENTRL